MGGFLDMLSSYILFEGMRREEAQSGSGMREEAIALSVPEFGDKGLMLLPILPCLICILGDRRIRITPHAG